MKNFYLVIDSLALNVPDPSDITLYLKEKIPYHFTRVGIKSIILLYSPPGESICYIHCDILNKDDNILNGERSDVLAIVPVVGPKKYWIYRPVNLHKEIKSSNFTSIRITLTDRDNVQMKHLKHLICELEFIN